MVTLVLGIGANSAFFRTINDLVLNPLPWDHSDRVVGIWEVNAERGGRWNVSSAKYPEWRKQARSFEGLAAVVAQTKCRFVQSRLQDRVGSTAAMTYGTRVRWPGAG